MVVFANNLVFVNMPVFDPAGGAESSRRFFAGTILVLRRVFMLAEMHGVRYLGLPLLGYHEVEEVDTFTQADRYRLAVVHLLAVTHYAYAALEYVSFYVETPAAQQLLREARAHDQSFVPSPEQIMDQPVPATVQTQPRIRRQRPSDAEDAGPHARRRLSSPDATMDLSGTQPPLPAGAQASAGGGDGSPGRAPAGATTPIAGSPESRPWRPWAAPSIFASVPEDAHARGPTHLDLGYRFRASVQTHLWSRGVLHLLEPVLGAVERHRINSWQQIVRDISVRNIFGQIPEEDVIRIRGPPQVQWPPLYPLQERGHIHTVADEYQRFAERTGGMVRLYDGMTPRSSARLRWNQLAHAARVRQSLPNLPINCRIRAALVICFRDADGAVFVAMAQQTAGPRNRRNYGDASGRWGLPGGGVERGETLSHAACAEGTEEVGIPGGTLRGRRGGPRYLAQGSRPGVRFPREEEMVCVELESTNRGASDGHLSTYYLVTVPQPFPLAPAPGLNAQGRRYMDEVYDTAWVPVANAPELLRRTDASALHHALATLDATHPHTTIPVGYEPEPPRPFPEGWPRPGTWAMLAHQRAADATAFYRTSQGPAPRGTGGALRDRPEGTLGPAPDHIACVWRLTCSLPENQNVRDAAGRLPHPLLPLAWSILPLARDLHLSGFVREETEEHVLVEAEGRESALLRLNEYFAGQDFPLLPAFSYDVTDVTRQWYREGAQAQGRYNAFLLIPMETPAQGAPSWPMVQGWDADTPPEPFPMPATLRQARDSADGGIQMSQTASQAPPPGDSRRFHPRAPPPRDAPESDRWRAPYRSRDSASGEATPAEYPSLPPFQEGSEQPLPLDLAEWTHLGERQRGLTHAVTCIFGRQMPVFLFRIRGMARTHDLGGVVSGGHGRNLSTDRGLLLVRARMIAGIARLWQTWLTTHDEYTFGFLETLVAVEPASYAAWLHLPTHIRDWVAQRGPLPLPQIAGIARQAEWRGHHADGVYQWRVSRAREAHHPHPWPLGPLGNAAHPPLAGAPSPVGGSEGEQARFARETVAFPYAAHCLDWNPEQRAAFWGYSEAPSGGCEDVYQRILQLLPHFADVPMAPEPLAIALVASTAPNLPYFRLMVTEARQNLLIVQETMRATHVFICNEIAQAIADFATPPPTGRT